MSTLNESNLHSYQRTAQQHLLDNNFAGLFMDMGLGKTVSCLTAIQKLIYDRLEISKVLIIAPKAVTENVWSDEIGKWDHLSHLKYSRIIGSAKQRKAALKAEADIYLVSKDNIAWLIAEMGGHLPFDMLVIDESSAFKNHKSVRFKALRKTLSSFKRRVILTGTPAPNGLIDLWSQIFILDQGQRLGQYITQYRREFFRPGHGNGYVTYNYKLRKDMDSVIYKKIEDICLSMKLKDYIDMPDLVENYITVKFPEALQKKYDDFEKEAVLELLKAAEEEGHAPGYITPTSAAGLSNKLLQFANGAVYDDEKNWHQVHDFKIEALASILEEAAGKPVLVAYSFKHDLERILKKLKKYSPVQYKGRAELQAWNRGEIPMMLMHPASAGHGLNLQSGGSIAVWFGMPWSLELYKQFNARLYRQGQTDTTFIHHIVAHKTIDLKVRNVLRRKHSSQESLLAAVKAVVAQYQS